MYACMYACMYVCVAPIHLHTDVLVCGLPPVAGSRLCAPNMHDQCMYECMHAGLHVSGDFSNNAHLESVRVKALPPVVGNPKRWQ